MLVMAGLTSTESVTPWVTARHDHQATRKGMASPADEQMNDRDDARSTSSFSVRAPAATGASTPVTPAFSATAEVSKSVETKAQDMDRYIAVGCLHLEQPLNVTSSSPSDGDWVELLYQEIPDEIKVIISIEASRMLEARWIRLFSRQQASENASLHGVVRVYLLPG
jgi:hypothetical protein